MITRRQGLGLLAAMACPGRVLAEGVVHEVQMLNRDLETGAEMAFAPALLQIEPGDTVRFLATDRGHNAASRPGMIPDGAAPWRTALNADADVRLTVPGTYGYVCDPHMTVGMVGLILVGDARENIETARAVRHRGAAGERFATLFDAAEALMKGARSGN